MKRNRVVVVAGGELTAFDVKQIDQDRDWIIAADGGAKHLADYGIIPHLLVGDMDTLIPEQLHQMKKQQIEIKYLPTEKNETDTHYACEQALGYQPEEIILLGVLGGKRFDHALANIGLLEWLTEQGMKAMIYAETNRLQLLVGPTKATIQKGIYQYLSLLPISEQVNGIYTQGLKYTLHNGTLTRGWTRGLSNEWADGQATIQIQRGKVLLVESSDWLF